MSESDAICGECVTQMTCAVFALYTHGPSLLQMNGRFDQSTTYGRFKIGRAHV